MNNSSLHRKLLILGGSSFVGRRLLKRLGRERAIATYNSNSLPDGIRFDSTSMGLEDIVPNPEVIDQAILLLGDTQPDSCVADRRRSHLVNVEGIKRVVDKLVEWSVRPVFTSSEFVFDGTKGGYIESDTPNPILLYGEQKLELERYIEDSTDDFAVLRLAKIYGDDPDDGTLFSSLMNIIRTDDSIKVAEDQKFSPIYVGDVCEAILAAVERNLQGLYHVAGPEGLTRLECTMTALEAVKSLRPTELEIETCSIHDFDLPEKRPVDVSMKPDKLVAESGLELRTAAESCRRIAEILHHDRN